MDNYVLICILVSTVRSLKWNLPDHIVRRCHVASAASLCVTFCSPGWPPGSLPRQRMAQEDLQGTDYVVR